MGEVWNLIESRARQTPDASMLVDQRGRTLTFAEYRLACESAAAGLVDLGIGRGSTVSWQLPTSLESTVLMGALARLGVTQNPLIPVLRTGELVPLFKDIAPDLFIVPPTWRGHDFEAMAHDLTNDNDANVLLCDHTKLAEIALPQGDPATLPPAEQESAVRWIYTTSGSTATPKAIAHTDASVIATSNSTVEQMPLAADDVFPVAFPIAHVGGISWLVAAWRTGCSLVLIDQFDPATSPLVMARYDATILGSATPFMFAYLEAQKAHGPEPLFPRLRFCMGGGGPIPPGLNTRLQDELGCRGIFNGYGLTECPIVGYPSWDDNNNLLDASAFVPGPDVAVRITDAEGDEVSPGVQGELRLRGPQLFSGYVNPALVATSFDSAGYVRTGDLAVQSTDGHVAITGRLKEIIVRNGENISTAELESALATHPGVADVAVIGLPDEIRGERICAVVVPTDPDQPPTRKSLNEVCEAAGLAPFKRVDVLRYRTALPRSPMGKLMKPAIIAETTAAHAS
jgi:acyl-CoA synthetase (AMP-forming)/AMP-acid ligase II